MRRQIGLTNRSEALPLDDLKWLQSQGYRTFNELPRMATWYRPDGTSSLGHADAYHLRLYRLRGMTLIPPRFLSGSVVDTGNPTSTVVQSQSQNRRPTKPMVVSRLLRVLGDDDSWYGTASELVNAFGIPRTSAVGLSRELFTHKVSVSLDFEGLSITRGWRGNKRILKVNRRH